MREVTLESEEWYVLCNWLRERENRLMYSLRSRSREWEFVHDLRHVIECRDASADTEGETADTGDATADTEDATADTAGTIQTVVLTDPQVEYVCSYLRRRAWKLLLLPWRSRERREVRHLRDHLREAAGYAE